MRLHVYLQARADAAYDNAYHHKLRGRMWRALDNTKFGTNHNSNQPTGFTFSNPFPWGDMREGDQLELLVAATREDLLNAIAADLRRNPELNIGEMPFTVEHISTLSPDVGEPGTSGVIETATGVVAKVPPRYLDDEEMHDDTGSDTDTFWKPEHGVEALLTYIEDQLQRTHDTFAPDYIPGPSEVDAPLFEELEFVKKFAIPVTLTTGVTHTYVLSKWRIPYAVRDDTHRKHLNLALDAGIGGRNEMGFGFLNIVKKEGESL